MNARVNAPPKIKLYVFLLVQLVKIYSKHLSRHLKIRLANLLGKICGIFTGLLLFVNCYDLENSTGFLLLLICLFSNY